MSLPKKGARRIVVDGRKFLWRIRHRPTYGQAICQAPLILAVEAADLAGSILLVLPQFHFGNGMNYSAAPVLPSHIENCVRLAVCAGWRFETPDKPFLFSQIAP